MDTIAPQPDLGTVNFTDEMLDNLTITISFNQAIRHRLDKLIQLNDQLDDLAWMVEMNSCNAEIPEVLGELIEALKDVSEKATALAKLVDIVVTGFQG